MEIKIYIANPAGNITVFVMSEADRKDYPWISKELLSMEKFHAEQVGFVEKMQDGTCRMQMMGGEFCGNATRSFGYLMNMLSQGKKEEIWVDVSGADEKLKVETDMEKGTAKTQMPLPTEIRELTLSDGEKVSMVLFDGICHIVAECAPKSQEYVDTLIAEAQKQYSCDAYGVMFWHENKMTPVVYVAGPNSMIWESSCGSGSIGVAVYLSREKETGEFIYELHQPGGTIEASVKKENGKVIQCQIGGPVTVSEEMTVHVG